MLDYQEDTHQKSNFSWNPWPLPGDSCLHPFSETFGLQSGACQLCQASALIHYFRDFVFSKEYFIANLFVPFFFKVNVTLKAVILPWFFPKRDIQDWSYQLDFLDKYINSELTEIKQALLAFWSRLPPYVQKSKTVDKFRRRLNISE